MSTMTNQNEEEKEEEQQQPQQQKRYLSQQGRLGSSFAAAFASQWWICYQFRGRRLFVDVRHGWSHAHTDHDEIITNTHSHTQHAYSTNPHSQK
jgi:hypothetical protein